MNNNYSILYNEYFCLDENDCYYVEDLDNRICEFLKVFNAKNIIIPTFIRRDILKKSGYFGKNKHQLTAVAVAHPDHYEQIEAESEIKGETAQLSGLYLTPAACLHVYPMFENKVITEPMCLTAKGKVYRYEGGDHDGLQHVWEFNVRECIFIGTESYVRESLKQFENWLYQYVLTIDNDATVQPAFDHFFGSPNQLKAWKKFQLKNQMKRELIVHVDDKEIALASFNYHGTQFSKAYNFDDNNEIVSGCVGVGHERWLKLIKWMKEK
ncbi:hypothetical protein SH1V18_25490 [Vallitalea longa]|uniref:Uncharacterized protein n=1 Tax=Vallitalea longa TaxID=2936439 RepID=A0A9W5YDS3_9FIRM|nr:hypothetical protein [Vallitalea longa]GKX30069.1 hypothetical protein SH1V18_25490 [Vallitalea longa]